MEAIVIRTRFDEGTESAEVAASGENNSPGSDLCIALTKETGSRAAQASLLPVSRFNSDTCIALPIQSHVTHYKLLHL